MYRVLIGFCDRADNCFEYHPGEVYPRDGITPSKERLAELSSAKNVMKTALIKEEAPKARKTSDAKKAKETKK